MISQPKLSPRSGCVWSGQECQTSAPAGRVLLQDGPSGLGKMASASTTAPLQASRGSTPASARWSPCGTLCVQSRWRFLRCQPPPSLASSQEGLQCLGIPDDSVLGVLSRISILSPSAQLPASFLTFSLESMSVISSTEVNLVRMQ